MSSSESQDWLNATKVATEALALAKDTAAAHRAHLHLTMLMLATLAKAAPKESIDQMITELERVRDLTGPAGVAAADVFMLATATLTRTARH